MKNFQFSLPAGEAGIYNFQSIFKNLIIKTFRFHFKFKILN